MRKIDKYIDKANNKVEQIHNNNNNRNKYNNNLFTWSIYNLKKAQLTKSYKPTG